MNSMKRIYFELIADKSYYTIDELCDRRDEIEEFGAHSADLREELIFIKDEIRNRNRENEK